VSDGSAAPSRWSGSVTDRVAIEPSRKVAASECTDPWVVIVIGTVAAVAAIGSMVYARRTWKAGQRANDISGSSAWATILMEHVAKEIANVVTERNVVWQLLKITHPNADAKRNLTTELQRLRDESHKRLHLLQGLVSESAALSEARDRLEAADDSHLENAELQLQEAKAQNLAEQHSRRYDEYVSNLREFARNLNNRLFTP
jgi:hypothetical protein